MLKNLKLSQQGLILLMVPLVFEIVFASALLYQLQEFDSLVQQVNKSRRFGSTISEIINNCYEIATTSGRIKEAKQLNEPLPIDAVREIKTRLAYMDDQSRTMMETAPTPAVANKVQRMLVPLKKLQKVVTVAVDCYDQGGALALYALLRGGKDKSIAAFIPARDDLYRSMGALLTAKHEQEADYDQKIAKQETSFQRLRAIVIIGGLFNVLVAMLLWVNFSRGTAESFRILIDNTYRLAQGKPLNPPIEGAGEIAHLDRVFKDMARALAEAAQYKKDLIAMVSHDLRTPLTSIQGFLTLLSTGMYGSLSQQGSEGLNIADANAARLISLINDLLDIEKMESGRLHMEFENADVDDIVQRSINAVIAFAQQQQVDLMADPCKLSVLADRARLVQVLVNLLSNAIKFSPPHSLVKVVAEELADCVEFRVIDQGRGVPEKFKESIFERFQQVQDSDAKVKGGSGLGLTICKAIVEGHRGSIGVNSIEGTGSTFWFRVPKQAVLSGTPVRSTL